MFKVAPAFMAVSFASNCPDLLAMRSENVVKSFSEAKLAGHWYENAF